MLGSLRNKWNSFQEDVASSVRSLQGWSSPSSAPTGIPLVSKHGTDTRAGGELLTYWQEEWEELHSAGDRNCRKAARCDRCIGRIRATTEKQWNVVEELQILLSQIPEINLQIEKAMKTLGNLESLFNDVELSLLALEDTIDARDYQARQQEQRTRLARLQQKRDLELKNLSETLFADHLKMKAEEEEQRAATLKKRQKHLQEQFERDMSYHCQNNAVGAGQSSKWSSSGGVSRWLTPPRVKTNADASADASLETVDLNDDDPSTLERFLAEDILFDVSPLPRDDDKGEEVKNLDLSDGFEFKGLSNEGQKASESLAVPEAGLYSTSRSVSPSASASPNSPPSSLDQKTDNNLSGVAMVGSDFTVSRSESLYFTPDNTMEKLRGDVEN